MVGVDERAKMGENWNGLLLATLAGCVASGLTLTQRCAKINLTAVNGKLTR